MPSPTILTSQSRLRLNATFRVVHCAIFCTFLAQQSALNAQAALGPDATHSALRTSAEELDKNLVHVPGIERDGSKRYLRSATGRRHRILGAHRGMPIVEGESTSGAKQAASKRVAVLRIHRDIYASPRRKDLLARGISLAAEHLRTPASRSWNATMYYDVLLGVHLDLGDALLREDGLRMQQLQSIAQRGDSGARRRARLLAFRDLYQASRRSSLGVAAKRALLRALGGALDLDLEAKLWTKLFPLAAPGKDDLPDTDYVLSFVIDGGLRDALGDVPGLENFEDVLRAQKRLRPFLAWRSKSASLTGLENDFEARAWVYQLPDVTRVLQSISIEDTLGDCELLCELPARTNPEAVEATRKAELLFEDRSVLRWQRGSKLEVVDRRLWDRLTAPKRRELRGWLPAHLPLMSIHGRVHAIVTEHGLVTAPGVEHEGRAWVQYAAKILKDPWHLDLVRVWFFRYVHDSPDSRHLRLPGTEEIHGDIHQTVDQTLRTHSLGRMCGDCDDLAEVFHEMHRAQGKLGHVLSVPGHAAYGFAEKQGRLWHAQALHTYEPVRFRARTLDAALKRLYGFFDPGAPIEAEQLPILLRFAGENRRDTWRLSSRIFADRKYADAMIDLQRDWHRHAFARGAKRMAERLDAGDVAFADRVEYAGLLERGGRWLEAARELAAIDELFPSKGGTEVPLRHIEASFEAGLADEAMASAERLRRERIQAIGRGKTEFLESSIALAFTVLGGTRDERAARLVLDMFDVEFAALRVGIKQSAGWLSSKNYDEDLWHGSPFHLHIRDAQRRCVKLALEIFERLPRTHRAWHGRRERLVQDVETWFQRVMPFDIEDPSDAFARYALLGEFLRITSGIDDLDLRVQVAAPPKTRRSFTKPKPRKSWQREFKSDLPWLQLALPWHMARVQTQIAAATRAAKSKKAAPAGSEGSGSPASIDEAALREGLARIERAWKGIRSLYPSLAPWYSELASAARFQVALVLGDEATQRRVLRRVKKLGDKSLTDTTVAAIASVAWLVDDARWQLALRVYAEELDYEPLWFEIVWETEREGAHARALSAANFACERHPEIEYFRFERDALAGR